MSPANPQFDAKSEASEPSDNITISLDNISLGREEENNSRLGHGNETQDLGSTGDNPLGTGGQKSLPAILILSDEPMKLEEVRKRFKTKTSNCLKPNVQDYYLARFREFAEASGFENYSTRQLAGPKGKELIMGWLDDKTKDTKASRLNLVASIKRVWMAVGLPWLITKDDIGKCPKVRREPTPPDKLVKEWGKALALEKDPYLKLVWLFPAQHGWRPSHCTGVRWSDVRYDEQGRPFEIIAHGQGGEFKTFAPVAVRLPPDVIESLEQLWKAQQCPNYGCILPFRTLCGRVDAGRRMSTPQFEIHWNALMDKYGLPKLRPKDLRHWVSTACRKAGLIKQASNYLQGHDAQTGNMRDAYDQPPLEEWLDDQGRKLPNGPLCTLCPVELLRRQTP